MFPDLVYGIESNQPLNANPIFNILPKMKNSPKYIKKIPCKNFLKMRKISLITLFGNIENIANIIVQKNFRN